MATLQAMLNSTDQSVRLKAALTAGTYPEPEYIDVLVSQCAHEPDFFVRDTLSWALLRNDIPKVVERLKSELVSENPQAMSQALHNLTKIADKRYYSLVTREHLLSKNEKVASTAWRTASILVSEVDAPALAELLVSQLGRGDSDLQFDLTRFLCAVGDAIIEPLTLATGSPEEEIRMHAEFTLIRYKEMELESSKKSTVGGEGFEPPTSSV